METRGTIGLLLLLWLCVLEAFDPSTALFSLLDSDGDTPLFDAKRLHRAVTDPAGRSLEQRLPAGLVSANRVDPSALLDLAFGLPPSVTGQSLEHSAAQQALQSWLFQRCDRLPRASGGDLHSGGLRRQCVESLASFAAALEVGKVVDETRRANIAATLGLSRKGAYLTGAEQKEEDVHLMQATAGASADVQLQQMLKNPEIAAALTVIARDPSALASYMHQPEVLEALDRLNMHLE